MVRGYFPLATLNQPAYGRVSRGRKIILKTYGVVVACVPGVVPSVAVDEVLVEAVDVFNESLACLKASLAALMAAL